MPLSTDTLRVQLLISTYLDQGVVADASWDGVGGVPDEAAATVKRDTTIIGGRRIDTEAVITVPSRVILTVGENLVVNGTILVDGALIISGSPSGSDTLIIGANGKVVGDTSGIHVVLLSRGSSGNNNGSSSTVNLDLLIGARERAGDGIWEFHQVRGTYATNR